MACVNWWKRSHVQLCTGLHGYFFSIEMHREFYVHLKLWQVNRTQIESGGQWRVTPLFCVCELSTTPKQGRECVFDWWGINTHYTSHSAGVMRYRTTTPPSPVLSPLLSLESLPLHRPLAGSASLYLSWSSPLCGRGTASAVLLWSRHYRQAHRNRALKTFDGISVRTEVCVFSYSDLLVFSSKEFHKMAFFAPGLFQVLGRAYYLKRK